MTTIYSQDGSTSASVVMNANGTASLLVEYVDPFDSLEDWGYHVGPFEARELTKLAHLTPPPYKWGGFKRLKTVRRLWARMTGKAKP